MQLVEHFVGNGLHLVIRPFICDYCGMRFDEKTYLKQHIGHRHMPKDQKCPDCDVMINSISVISHKQIHRKKHICEKCGRLFQTAKRLEAHMEKNCLAKTREELERDPEFLAKKFKCIMCIYRGPNERALNKHIQRVHAAKNMEKEKTCEICNKQFTKIAYAYHVRTHGRIKCEKCNKNLSAGSGFFKQHMLNHEKEEAETRDPESHQVALGPDGIFRCYGDNCSYKTHKKRLFVRHYQNKHGPKLLKCDFPGCESAELMSEKQLWRHKNSHKRKDCEICGAVFNDLRDLNRHMANNLCDKTKDSQPIHDLKCEQCEYTTYQANALVRHRLHYHAPVVGRCTIPGCPNKELMTKAKLGIHVSRHKERGGWKKQPCDICGMLKTSSWNLKKHMEVCKGKKRSYGVKKEEIVNDEKEENFSKDEENVSKEPEIENISINLLETAIKMEPETEIEIKQEPEEDIQDEIEEKYIKTEYDSEHYLSDDPFQSYSSLDETKEDEMSVKCDFCEFTTTQTEYLKRHISTKHDPSPIKCPDCDKEISKVSYNQHRLTHAKDHICLLCVKNYSARWKLKRHIERRHPKINTSDPDKDFFVDLTPEQLKCQKCAHKSSDIDEYRNHSKMHDEAENYNCDQCSYKTSNKKTLQSHIYLTHDPKLLNCHICSKKIAKFSFKKHLQSHTLEFSCSICSKRTSTRWNLKEHINKNHPGRKDLIDEINAQSKAAKLARIVSQPKHMQCAHCEYTTDERRNFINHFLRIHSTSRCTCPVCGNSVSQIDFKRHLSQHETPTQRDSLFMCEKCSRVFVQERSLEVHTLSCSGQVKISSTKFKCDHCDYATGTKKGIRNHHYMVHAPKTSECPVCKKMMTKAKLSGHLRYHDMRLTCSLCLKDNFATRWHLKVHILRVHPGNEQLIVNEGLIKKKKSVTNEEDGESETVCTECGKVLKGHTRLSTHMLIHNKPLRCTNEWCDKRFVFKYSLRNHLARCKIDGLMRKKRVCKKKDEMEEEKEGADEESAA